MTTLTSGCDGCLHLQKKVSELEERISVLHSIQDGELLMDSLYSSIHGPLVPVPDLDASDNAVSVRHPASGVRVLDETVPDAGPEGRRLPPYRNLALDDTVPDTGPDRRHLPPYRNLALDDTVPTAGPDLPRLPSTEAGELDLAVFDETQENLPGSRRRRSNILPSASSTPGPWTLVRRGTHGESHYPSPPPRCPPQTLFPFFRLWT